jgi:uncharacterized iron-regulated membrane protein
MLFAVREFFARENGMPWLEVAIGAGSVAVVVFGLLAARLWKIERERVRSSKRRRDHDAKALQQWEEMHAALKRARDC